jgi:hypothetical protein
MEVFIIAKASKIWFKVPSLTSLFRMYMVISMHKLITNRAENVAINVKGFIGSKYSNMDWNHSAQQKACQITYSLQPDLLNLSYEKITITKLIL